MNKLGLLISGATITGFVAAVVYLFSYLMAGHCAALLFGLTVTDFLNFAAPIAGLLIFATVLSTVTVLSGAWGIDRLGRRLSNAGQKNTHAPNRRQRFFENWKTHVLLFFVWVFSIPCILRVTDGGSFGWVVISVMLVTAVASHVITRLFPIGLALVIQAALVVVAVSALAGVAMQEFDKREYVVSTANALVKPAHVLFIERGLVAIQPRSCQFLPWSEVRGISIRLTRDTAPKNDGQPPALSSVGDKKPPPDVSSTNGLLPKH